VFLPPSSAVTALVDAEFADETGLLGNQRLDGALLQRLDLIRACVEADDLHLAALASLLDAGGRAFGGEQVGSEDPDEVGVLLQLGADELGPRWAGSSWLYCTPT